MSKERFAARLKELREDAGLTQKALAEKAGLTYGAVRDVEQALNGPTWDTVLALSKALGVTCEAFDREPSSQSAEPKRGRPPKPASADDDAAPRGAAEPAKKRGRPKKPKE